MTSLIGAAQRTSTKKTLPQGFWTRAVRAITALGNEFNRVDATILADMICGEATEEIDVHRELTNIFATELVERLVWLFGQLPAYRYELAVGSRALPPETQDRNERMRNNLNILALRTAKGVLSTAMGKIADESVLVDVLSALEQPQSSSIDRILRSRRVQRVGKTVRDGIVAFNGRPACGDDARLAVAIHHWYADAAMDARTQIPIEMQIAYKHLALRLRDESRNELARRAQTSYRSQELFSTAQLRLFADSAPSDWEHFLLGSNPTSTSEHAAVVALDWYRGSWDAARVRQPHATRHIDTEFAHAIQHLPQLVVPALVGNAINSDAEMGSRYALGTPRRRLFEVNKKGELKPTLRFDPLAPLNARSLCAGNRINRWTSKGFESSVLLHHRLQEISGVDDFLAMPKAAIAFDPRRPWSVAPNPEKLRYDFSPVETGVVTGLIVAKRLYELDLLELTSEEHDFWRGKVERALPAAGNLRAPFPYGMNREREADAVRHGHGVAIELPLLSIARL